MSTVRWSREAAEFLPAVLEIQETPPPPAARWILWTIVGCLVAALAWSLWAQVDVVAVAPGKIIPAGNVKTLQAFELGRVRSIHVREGQHVAAGEVLIELDPALSEADVEATGQRLERLEKTLPLVSERAAAARRLNRQGLIPRSDYLALEEQRIGAEHELAAARQELVKARERARWQRLVAPVSGIVQQLAVHTVGGVVTPAEPLMVIVPDGERLEVEAYVANKDVGFVWAGQPVELKLETFPFTRYGTVGGTLQQVSDDAIPHETLGLVYSARVALDRRDMNIDGRTVKLSPGMAVTAEIKTGRRRVIEYFLSPLQRHASESVRER